MSNRVYKIREILDKRELREKTLYLISWEGYSSSHDSWEPEENLIGCEGLIDAFNRRSWSPQPEGDRKAKSGSVTRTRTSRSSTPVSPQSKLHEPTKSPAKTLRQQPTVSPLKVAMTYNLRSYRETRSRPLTRSITGSSPSNNAYILSRRSLAGTAKSRQQQQASVKPATTKLRVVATTQPSTPPSPPISSRVRTRLQFTATSTRPVSRPTANHRTPTVLTEADMPGPAERTPTPPLPADNVSSGEETETITVPPSDDEDAPIVPAWLRIGVAEGLFALSVTAAAVWYMYF